MKSPDGYLHQDVGCDIYPRCLDCPLPKCRFDNNLGRARLELKTRNADIMLHHQAGEDLGQLATNFGLSKRTILRIISR